MDEKWHSQRSLKFFGQTYSEVHAFLDKYFREFGPSHRQLLHHGPDNCSLGAAIPSSGRIGGWMLKTKYQNQGECMFDHPKIGKELGLHICEQMLSELVYNMANYEGSPLTPIETDLITEGFSVGNGKTIEQVNQAYNIAKSWKALIHSVKSESFTIDKRTFVGLNALVAKDEPLSEIGDFRSRTRFIKNTRYTPPLPIALDNLFQDMLVAYKTEKNDIKKGYDLFLEASRNQFFGDGNKRTAQLLMNGHFLMNGYAPISFTPEYKEEFFTKMREYYETNEKEGMYSFLGKRQAQIGMEKGGSRLSEQQKIAFQKILQSSLENEDPDDYPRMGM
jgi:prophage maintenance system killer protein